MNDRTNDIFKFNVAEFWKRFPPENATECITATNLDTGGVVLISQEKWEKQTPDETAKELDQFYYQYQFFKQELQPEFIKSLARFLEDEGYLLRILAFQLTIHLIEVYEHLYQELLQTDEAKFASLVLAPKREHPQFILLTDSTGKIERVKIKFDEEKIEMIFKINLLFLQKNLSGSELWQDCASYVLTHLALESFSKMERDWGENTTERMESRQWKQTFERYFPDTLANSQEFAEKLEDLLKLYSQTIINPLIDSFKLQNQATIEILEEIFVCFPVDNPVPVTESQLTAPIVPIPTNVALFSSIKAQLRKDLWQKDPQTLACFKHQAKGNPSNYIEHFVTHAGQLQILPWEQAEQIIDKFGFDTVKLHLIFAAHTMNYERPWENQFTLKGTDIIQYLGWDSRTDLPLSEKLNKIAQTAFVLDCLLVKSVWIEGTSPKGGINASTPVGRMWNLVIDPRGQLNREGKVEKPEEVYLTIQPGLIFKSFLNKAGRQMKEALYQFGYLAQHLLQIDPYHQELTFRLAVHLTIESRYHKSGSYQVETLLKAILPNRVVDEARTDKDKARRLKHNWDKAIEDLQTLDWQIQFDESYQEWLQPGSQVPKPPGSKKISILERVLQAKMVIKPPESLPELTKAKKAPQPKRTLQPSVTTSRLTAEQIRQGRKAQGWSQRELAKQLKVSNGLVGSWETGKRIPSPDMEAKLLQLLKIKLDP